MTIQRMDNVGIVVDDLKAVTALLSNRAWSWRGEAFAVALASRADVIVTKHVRHVAPERLTEPGLLVQTADAFLIHDWWLDPQSV